MTRVALTTSPDRVTIAAARLRGLGHEPVILPCIEVKPASTGRVTQIRNLASSCDVILLTSPRAVEAVWARHEMPPTPVIAVGETTAATARTRGGNVTVVGEGDLESLLSSVHLADHTVLYPCSTRVDTEDRERALMQRDAEPVILPAYVVTPVAPGDDEVDVAVFASPSAVDGWLESRPLEGLSTVAIGPTTGKRLHDAGYPPTKMSDRPDLVHSAELAAKLGVKCPPP